MSVYSAKPQKQKFNYGVARSYLGLAFCKLFALHLAQNVIFFESHCYVPVLATPRIQLPQTLSQNENRQPCMLVTRRKWRLSKNGDFKLAIKYSDGFIHCISPSSRVVCHLLWPLVWSSWEGVFPIWHFLFSYYINPNPKLTYLLPIPFDFRDTDLPQLRLRKPLMACTKGTAQICLFSFRFYACS